MTCKEMFIASSFSCFPFSHFARKFVTQASITAGITGGGLRRVQGVCETRARTAAAVTAEGHAWRKQQNEGSLRGYGVVLSISTKQAAALTCTDHSPDCFS